MLMQIPSVTTKLQEMIDCCHTEIRRNVEFIHQVCSYGVSLIYTSY